MRIIIGGGGGGQKYGIRNYLRVYNKQTRLQNHLWQQVTDEDYISEMDLASQNQPYLIACRGPFMVIYKIIQQEDHVSLRIIYKAQVDFSKRDPLVKVARFSYNNKYIIAGGSDMTVRVWSVKWNEEGEEQKKQEDQEVQLQELYKINDHYESINSVDFSRNLKYFVSASNDMTCRVYQLQNAKLVAKLTFSPTYNSGQLSFKGCRFSNSSKFLYTMQTGMNQGTFVTKWEVDKEFQAVASIKVHDKPGTHLALSRQALHLGVSTADGYVANINTRYMEVDRKIKTHKLAVLNVNFTNDDRFLISCSADNSYQFTANLTGGGIWSVIFKICFVSLFFYWLYSITIGNLIGD